MNIERLTLLRQFLLANVKDEQLQMKNWVCGTERCAIGWATECPELKSQGLTLKGLPKLDGSESNNIEPYYITWYGFPAIEEFFDLTGKQAQWLFNHDAYQNPMEEEIYATVEDVCERIQRIIDGEDISKYRIHKCYDD